MDNKKPNDINFTEVDIDTYQPDEIKRAEDIINSQVDKTPYVVPVANDKPELDIKKFRQEKKDFIQNDNLLKMIQQGANSFNLLDKIMEEAAIDTASLKFDRENNDNFLIDSTKVIKARGQALKLLSDLIISKKELARDTTVNLKSKKLAAVFDYFFQIIRTTLAQTEGISPEQRELFFSILQKNLENFEEDAERVMKKVDEE